MSPVKYFESNAGGLVFLLVPFNQEKSANAKGSLAGTLTAGESTILSASFFCAVSRIPAACPNDPFSNKKVITNKKNIVFTLRVGLQINLFMCFEFLRL